MMDEQTIQKLYDLKLHAMADAVRELLTSAPGNGMSFEEKLGLVVEREWTDRENKRLARRLKEAKLGTNACLEDVWCEPARGLDKDVVRSLGTCQWVRAKQNVIAIGATGVGKSFLGAALAQAACRSGFRALCTRVPMAPTPRCSPSSPAQRCSCSTTFSSRLSRTPSAATCLRSSRTATTDPPR
jgi:DNA replication protein DnaC